MKYKNILYELNKMDLANDYDELDYTPDLNKYKNINRTFIHSLKERIKEETNLSLGETEDWTDGYFVYSFGEDSVYKLEYKEWAFGFWFDTTTDNENNEYYRVRAFAQPILSIDKFKPSYSTFSEELLIPVEIINKYTKEVDNYLIPLDVEELDNQLKGYIEYSEVEDMLVYILKNNIDALYRAWYTSGKFVRLPNKFITKYKVHKRKKTLLTWEKDKERLTVDTYKFITEKLSPLFSIEESNTILNIQYNSCMSPSFTLVVIPVDIDKKYTAEKLNTHFIPTYAEYLVSKWNKYTNKKYKHYSSLKLEYKCWDAEDECYIVYSYGYNTLQEWKEELKDLKKQYGRKAAKSCIWLEDLEGE